MAYTFVLKMLKPLSDSPADSNQLLNVAQVKINLSLFLIIFMLFKHKSPKLHTFTQCTYSLNYYF